MDQRADLKQGHDPLPVMLLVISSIVLIGFGVLVYLNQYNGTAACASIGAEFRWGRDMSVCVKPDGSLWELPKP